MKNQTIICGEGHGIKCVYDGLIAHSSDFILCSTDDDLLSIAKSDGIRTCNDYKTAIQHKDDIVLTAAYRPKILPQDLVLARFINIHYALLPKYRGMHAIVWAMLNNESDVGFTLHETTTLLDQGPIIYQDKVSVKDKTSWELMIEIDNLVTKSIYNILENFKLHKKAPKPQNESEAIFVAPRNEEDCKVIWKEWDALFFSRALKALVPPYPLPYFFHNGNKIEILKAEVLYRNYVEINGHLVYIDNDAIYIKIPKGLIKIFDLKINGKQVKATTYFSKIGVRL